MTRPQARALALTTACAALALPLAVPVAAAEPGSRPAAKTVQVPLWDVSRIQGQGTFTLRSIGTSPDGATTRDIVERSTIVITGSPLKGKQALILSSRLDEVPITAKQVYDIAGSEVSQGTECTADESVSKAGDGAKLTWPMSDDGLPAAMGIGRYSSSVDLSHLSGITWSDGWSPIFQLVDVVSGPTECTPPGDPTSTTIGKQTYVATKGALVMTSRGSGPVTDTDGMPATLEWEFTYRIPRGGWKTMAASTTKPVGR